MIKNKRLIILILLIAVTIIIFLFIKINFHVLPIKLKSENISEIEISLQNSKKYMILSGEIDAAIIKEITILFNKSKKHHDQGIGTTHPICVYIKSNNKKDIRFWCGVGDFITVACNDRQYNYINYKLNEYIEKLLD